MRIGGILTIALLLSGSQIASATNESAPLDVPATDIAPKIDGVLTDTAWSEALVVSHFVARLPVDGAEPSLPTEVRLVHTRRALYVALHAFDSHPDLIRATSMRRDDFAITSGDQFVIAIDTFHDRRNGYWFSTNPLAARVDAQFSEEGDRFEDAWDGVWKAAARIDSTGWTAELEIPWATLRFHEAKQVVMGINLYRRIPHTNEQVFAPAIPLKYAYGTPNVSAARAYRFTGISGGTRLDLRPFGLASVDRRSGEAESNKTDAGFFARAPVTNAMTVAGTLHADFSEVEADENQLNLTRFPLFLPEKRDFFLEDAGLFSFGVPGEAELFFSRTIGLITDSTGETATVPIAWGAKGTGRAGRLEFGVLSGATEAAFSTPGERFDVGRARLKLGARSTVGAFWSRRDAADSINHTTFGADFSQFLLNEIRLQGFVARDEEGADDRGAWYLALSRGGERTAFTLSALEFDSGFSPALGLVARPGTRRIEVSTTVPWFPTTRSRIRRYAPGVSYVRYDNLDNEGFDERSTVSFGVARKNDFLLTVGVTRQRERLTTPFNIYRDIPVASGDYQRWEGTLSMESDPTRKLSGTAEIRAGGLYGGSHVFTSVGLTWRPNRYVVLAPALLTDRVSLPEARFRATVVRLRLGLTLSPSWRFDILGQTESERRGRGIGLRARYDIREGTRVVLAWDSVELRLPADALPGPPVPIRPARTERGALKASYLILF